MICPGTILLLIYFNDLPRVCKSTEVVLFAYDTNLSAMDTSLDYISANLQSVNGWLISNQLVFNVDQTVVLNVSNRAFQVCLFYYTKKSSAICIVLEVFRSSVRPQDVFSNPY